MYPEGVAVDAAGSVYISSSTTNQVFKETFSAGGYTESTISSGFDYPIGIAVDGAGNVYIADTAKGVLKETLSGGSYTQSVVNSQSFPAGVAVDGGGTVYISNGNTNLVLKETLSGNSYTESLITTALGEPMALAVDQSGNLYVADLASSSVYKFTPSAGNYTQSLVANNLVYPEDVAVDGSGNVYLSSSSGGTLIRLAPSADGYTQSIVPTTGLSVPFCIAVGGNGSVYIGDTNNDRVLKEDFSDPPTLSFAPTDVGSTSADSPETETVENIGNAVLNLTGLSYPTDFPEQAGGGTNACTSTTSLNPGGMCDLKIDFTPQADVGKFEDVTLTDNALNVAGAQQVIQLSGLRPALAATQLVVSAPASTQSGSAFTLTVTALDSLGYVVTTYSGSVAFTSSDPLMVNPGTLTLSGGVGHTTVTLRTAGFQTITATDATNHLGGTSSVITVANSGLQLVTFGSQAIGTSSAGQTLTFSFPAGTTVGSIQVVTQGATGLDFTNPRTGSCTAGTAYSAGATCTVGVTFKPTLAGSRYGAAVLLDPSGNVLATLYVQGTGIVPQVSFVPGTQSTLVSGLYSPWEAAVDPSGNVYQ